MRINMQNMQNNMQNNSGMFIFCIFCILQYVKEHILYIEAYFFAY
jgi:hypothetical protein